MVHGVCQQQRLRTLVNIFMSVTNWKEVQVDIVEDTIHNKPVCSGLSSMRGGEHMVEVMV
jgi:hypothetical protein